MKKLSVFCYLVILLLFFSCMKHVTKTKLKENFPYVYLIPDSVLTPSQHELKKKLMEIQLEYVIVEDNRFLLKASREDFIQRGVPLEYYELLVKNLKDNNRYIKKNKIANTEEMYDKSLISLREALKMEK